MIMTNPVNWTKQPQSRKTKGRLKNFIKLKNQ